jgi:hypothetical protein
VRSATQLAGAAAAEAIRDSNLSADHHGGINEKIMIIRDAGDVLILAGHFEGVDALAHVSVGQRACKDKDAIEAACRPLIGHGRRRGGPQEKSAVRPAQVPASTEMTMEAVVVAQERNTYPAP